MEAVHGYNNARHLIRSSVKFVRGDHSITHAPTPLTHARAALCLHFCADLSQQPTQRAPLINAIVQQIIR